MRTAGHDLHSCLALAGPGWLAPPPRMPTFHIRMHTAAPCATPCRLLRRLPRAAKPMHAPLFPHPYTHTPTNPHPHTGSWPPGCTPWWHGTVTWTPWITAPSLCRRPCRHAGRGRLGGAAGRQSRARSASGQAGAHSLSEAQAARCRSCRAGNPTRNANLSSSRPQEITAYLNLAPGASRSASAALEQQLALDEHANTWHAGPAAAAAAALKKNLELGRTSAPREPLAACVDRSEPLTGPMHPDRACPGRMCIKSGGPWLCVSLRQLVKWRCRGGAPSLQPTFACSPTYRPACLAACLVPDLWRALQRWKAASPPTRPSRWLTLRRPARLPCLPQAPSPGCSAPLTTLGGWAGVWKDAWGWAGAGRWVARWAGGPGNSMRWSTTKVSGWRET